MDAYRKLDFINRTVQLRIGETITTGLSTYPIYHSHPFSDPEDIREDNGTPEIGFVTTVWNINQAGRRGFAMLQVDVWRRRGAEGDAGGDPFGTEVSNMSDAIQDIFTGLNANGTHKGSFNVLDFTIPASPIDTGKCMMCINTAGDVGEVDNLRVLGLEDGYNRIVMRFRFKLKQDLAGQAAFYV